MLVNPGSIVSANALDVSYKPRQLLQWPLSKHLAERCVFSFSFPGKCTSLCDNLACDVSFVLLLSASLHPVILATDDMGPTGSGDEDAIERCLAPNCHQHVGPSQMGEDDENAGRMSVDKDCSDGGTPRGEGEFGISGTMLVEIVSKGGCVAAGAQLYIGISRPNYAFSSSYYRGV